MQHQQFSFCFSQRYDPFVVGPLGPEKSPDGDTTNGIYDIINRTMRIAAPNSYLLTKCTGCFIDKVEK